MQDPGLALRSCALVSRVLAVRALAHADLHKLALRARHAAVCSWKMSCSSLSGGTPAPATAMSTLGLALRAARKPWADGDGGLDGTISAGVGLLVINHVCGTCATWAKAATRERARKDT